MSHVTNMRRVFVAQCYGFNVSLDNWDVSNVEDMSEMFSECFVYNQPILNWNVSNVQHMGGTFEVCSLFNQPVKWKSGVPNVKSMKKNVYIVRSL